MSVTYLQGQTWALTHEVVLGVSPRERVEEKENDDKIKLTKSSIGKGTRNQVSSREVAPRSADNGKR